MKVIIAVNFLCLQLTILKLDIQQLEILCHMLNVHTVIIHNILGEENIKLTLK